MDVLNDCLMLQLYVIHWFLEMITLLGNEYSFLSCCKRNYEYIPLTDVTQSILSDFIIGKLRVNMHRSCVNVKFVRYFKGDYI